MSGGGRSSGLMSFLKIGDRAAGAIKSGRHDAARRQDGDGRHRSPRHRAIHRLEGGRGAEGRGAGRRLEARAKAPQRRSWRRASTRRRRWARALRPQEESGPEARDQGGAPRHAARELRPARHPIRPAGLHNRSTSAPTTPIGTARPISRSPARTRTIRCASPTTSSTRGREGRRLASDPPHRRQGVEDAQGARTVGEDRATPPGPAPIPALQFDTTINEWHTCPASGRINASNPCSEYMFLDDTACNLASLNLLTFRKRGWDLRHRGLRARDAAVDHHARNLGADGAVPVARDRAALLRVPHPRPGLSPISAGC